MKKIVTGQQMKAVDDYAINVLSIPSIVLMENAACAVTVRILEFFDEKNLLKYKSSVVILCGKGNNGGDGFAIARQLFSRGFIVKIIKCFDEENGLSNDCRINLITCQKLGIPMCFSYDQDAREAVLSATLIIDAIYGTGFIGEFSEKIYAIADIVNNSNIDVIAVDIPSGIHSDGSDVCKNCINAQETVTFAAYKTSMLAFPARQYCGVITFAEISMPEQAFESLDNYGGIIDSQFIYKNLPKRTSNSHKGDYGKLFVVGGSEGMLSAPIMSANAAMRMGVGLVMVGIAQSLSVAAEAKLTEPMSLPLIDNNGEISVLSHDIIVQKANESDALLIGGGMGRGKNIRQLLEIILPKIKVPVIMDADAINALAMDPSILSECICDVVLTPHSMEMARLCSVSVDEIESDRLFYAKKVAEDYGVTVVLKGAHTICVMPDLTYYYNVNGNSGMATGGSGDVLAGIIGAVASMGVLAETAAVMGVYIHGMAGDLASNLKGEYGLIATDIIECLPQAVKMITKNV